MASNCLRSFESSASLSFARLSTAARAATAAAALFPDTASAATCRHFAQTRASDDAPVAQLSQERALSCARDFLRSSNSANASRNLFAEAVEQTSAFSALWRCSFASAVISFIRLACSSLSPCSPRSCIWYFFAATSSSSTLFSNSSSSPCSPTRKDSVRILSRASSKENSQADNCCFNIDTASKLSLLLLLSACTPVANSKTFSNF
mmetsp:Transcript_91890/g.145315  ORF Transcript_91890/g.145315 Transcript_91890/m.145315 type:complete len:207 (+) Transcript_91890:440-1060(+)